jgi:SAM-dependent methyltransferase
LDKNAFDEMIGNQSAHWWFEGRKRVIDRIIGTLGLPGDCRILEIGCGTGANVEVLARHGRVCAIELDDYARDYTIRTNPGLIVKRGWLPDGLSCISGEKFDLICLFDVLEHVEDDESAICNLRSFLGESAKLLVTVPAYQSLFGKHDRALGHFRRYNRGDLSMKFERNGYKVNFISYINVFALPLMAIARLIERIAEVPGPSLGSKKPAWAINRAMLSLFALETAWLPRRSSPFGGSVAALAERA